MSQSSVCSLSLQLKDPWQIGLSEQHEITREKQEARKRVVDTDSKEVHLSQMYVVFLPLGIIWLTRPPVPLTTGGLTVWLRSFCLGNPTYRSSTQLHLRNWPSRNYSSVRSVQKTLSDNTLSVGTKSIPDKCLFFSKTYRFNILQGTCDNAPGSLVVFGYTYMYANDIHLINKYRCICI